MTITLPFPVLLAIHLAPTVVVLVTGWIVFRAVSLRIQWRER